MPVTIVNYYHVGYHISLYYPIVVTCQLHTDDTVSAHDMLIFDPFSVVFVKCTDYSQQLDVFIVQEYHTVDTDSKSAVV